MKKTKFVVSAIALFAVVGASLAFKAQKFSNTYFYTAVGSSCVSVPGNFHRVDIGGTQGVGTIAGTTAPSVCNSTILTAPND